MLVFVDESGDPGVKGKRGSSRYFIVTAVVFEDDRVAETCERRIDALRRELGLPEYREFRFNKCNRAIREAFLRAVARFDFKYVAFILNKDPDKLSGPGFRYQDSLYKLSIRYTFTNAEPLLDNAVVVIDRTGSRDFVRQLDKYLRRRINLKEGPPLIRKVRSQSSHSHNLIQMADMVCGAVARSLRAEKRDHPVYRELIRRREFGVQLWPR
jgi:hypothetical protein